MQSIQKTIQDLSDSEVVKVTKELFNIVYIQVPYDKVLHNSEGITAVNIPLLLSGESLEYEMTTTESAEVCRFVLEMYVKNPELEPFVQQAWKKVKGADTLFIEEVIVFGILINLTLLNATTSFKWTKDANGNTTCEFAKKEASPELIKSLFSPITELFKKLTLDKAE